MRRRLESERGAALLLSAVFLLTSLSMASVLRRQLLMLMNIAQFETHLDQPASHVLQTGFARALSLMQTGLPATAYSCSLVLTETAGSPTVNLSWAPQGAQWAVTVAQSPAAAFAPCPADFSDFEGES